MTNKQELYYVISESELTERDQALAEQRHCEEFGFPFDETRLKKAEAACRSRVVPNWATHFAQIEQGTDELERWEEIVK